MVKLFVKESVLKKIEKKHGVNLHEVHEVLAGRIYIRKVGKSRYMVIGKTSAGRLLTVIIDASAKNVYELVTARDSTESEKRIYKRKSK